MTVYGRNRIPRRVAIYRLYDSADQLLYVGITEDIKDRFGRHAMTKAWWSSVARKDVTWIVTSWSQALRLEKTIIREEQPKYNGTHNYPEVQFNAAAWPAIAVSQGKGNVLAERIRQEIRSGRWEAGARIPTRSQIANASGISKSTVAAVYRQLQDEGLLWCLNGVGSFVSNGATIQRPNHAGGPDRLEAAVL